MNKTAAHAGDEPPPAKTRKRKWTIPFIWIVPIVAAIVAGYLIYQRVREYGGTITILFRDVDGIKPGQTPLQYRGAEVGQVASVGLSKNQQYASVEVKLRRRAADVARQGSSFWIVRPQLSMGTLTGLGTIITGPYIAVLPGNGKRVSKFTGVEESPTMLDPNGLTVVLLTAHGGSLRAGVPIYYRGIEVGAVRETRLSTNADAVEIHVVIRQRYAPLVRSESKFWNVTGLEMHLGLFQGAEVNVESLKSLLIGGIAFATPDDPKQRPARKGMVFRLYDEADKEWFKWAPRIPIQPEENAADIEAQNNPLQDLTVPQNRPP